MDNKVLSVGDYILITDNSTHDYYLQIGFIKSISYKQNREIQSYNVKFNMPYDLFGSVGMLQKAYSFAADLPNRCKVLNFKE